MRKIRSCLILIVILAVHTNISPRRRNSPVHGAFKGPDESLGRRCSATLREAWPEYCRLVCAAVRKSPPLGKSQEEMVQELRQLEAPFLWMQVCTRFTRLIRPIRPSNQAASFHVNQALWIRGFMWSNGWKFLCCLKDCTTYCSNLQHYFTKSTDPLVVTASSLPCCEAASIWVQPWHATQDPSNLSTLRLG